LGISRPYLYRLLDAGKIPFAYVGTHRRIKRGDIDLYLARRDTATTDLVVRLANASEAARDVRRAAMDEALDKAGWD
jgi:excisionase family DNA binding protein